MNKRSRHTFGFDLRHVARNALASRAAMFMMCVFFYGLGGADSEVERNRIGSSLIAYPVTAEMMDPPTVSKSEPA